MVSLTTILAKPVKHVTELFSLLALSSGSSDETNEWEEVGHKNKSTITRVVRRIELNSLKLNHFSKSFPIPVLLICKVVPP